ncbi:hypothetical protein THF5H11_90023 [Vibrio jasicida]|uniref:Uncharacterized protein n=1 Tax=Vibrio jasicida TaxID=766224 RepID=A0AAU9QT55_9VIBR|nr:hypothetical protein THF5H11_90023 [Vibrio jasicida]CAH1580094.1 hypothetical protein THF1C08_220008 [Vibrio jasicida]CAH1597938.1 hypothetical protein THF1A12_340008 [Vibrio jasicida]CAH1605227.1 hypothetical protein THF5G08_120092 [Vibrio jasicida]
MLSVLIDETEQTLIIVRITGRNSAKLELLLSEGYKTHPIHSHSRNK